MKPGKQTTEFWITLAVQVIGGILTLLGTIGVIDADSSAKLQAAVPALIGAVMQTVSAVIYTISRTKVKTVVPPELIVPEVKK